MANLTLQTRSLSGGSGFGGAVGLIFGLDSFGDKTRGGRGALPVPPEIAATSDLSLGLAFEMRVLRHLLVEDPGNLPLPPPQRLIRNARCIGKISPTLHPDRAGCCSHWKPREKAV